ncbi:protein cornichon homolog 4-like [Nilaparvata lugens]|uniref:protein cornichon homolog 4-like n=1 Tax=Nilaparvata lugens TaxID=108931 RepID=UPI00193D6FAA|nr:protein cornichon homolog 4-like [Nilaparvata lugens]
MAGGPFLFAFALVDTGSILFLLVYYVITLSDLECDYLNAQECCSKLNYWVLPKLIVHGLLVAIFLLSGHWWLVCLNIPIMAWMIYE